MGNKDKSVDARFQASAAVQWSRSLVWDVTQRIILIVTDMCQAGFAWPLKMDPIICPETSIHYQHTLRNIAVNEGCKM